MQTGCGLVAVEEKVGGMPRPPECSTGKTGGCLDAGGGTEEHSTKFGCKSEAIGSSNVGEASDGSIVAIEELKGGLPRPPEFAAGGTGLPRDVQIVVETHLSPQASDVSAPGGIGAQSGAEAVVDARLKQAKVKAQGNEITGNAGTDEHDTKFGCESGAGGCRLACAGATRPSGSNVDRWAGEEISGSEGNSSAAGGGSRTSLGQQVAAGDAEGENCGSVCNSSWAGARRRPPRAKGKAKEQQRAARAAGAHDAVVRRVKQLNGWLEDIELKGVAVLGKGGYISADGAPGLRAEIKRLSRQAAGDD